MHRRRRGVSCDCGSEACSICWRRASCSVCGVIQLYGPHLCVVAYEVKIPGVMSRSRRVRARAPGEAAVMLADELDRAGNNLIESGSEMLVRVRKSGTERWATITLTAVDVTTYHPTTIELG